MVNFKSKELRNSRNKINLLTFSCIMEIAIRVLLLFIFITLEKTQPFKRKIHPEELWMYKNPITSDYIPAWILLTASFCIPFTMFLINFLWSHNIKDFIKANQALTLSLFLNGILTSLLKVCVGRPRPDFFYRCFPDGLSNIEMNCAGEKSIVNEGRKSFPSGHSSFAFSGFGFMFLYIAAKLDIFNEIGQGKAWRFCASITPLFVALIVALSRICDYHHHWQDVFVGSFIGFGITYICYRQYFPKLSSINNNYTSGIITNKTEVLSEYSNRETDVLIVGENKDSKFI